MILPGVKDPICDATQQYIKEENLNSEEQQEMRELALALKRMGVQDTEDCKLITEGSVEYFLGEKISPTGVNMLQKEFKIAKKPVDIACESGRHIHFLSIITTCVVYLPKQLTQRNV